MSSPVKSEESTVKSEESREANSKPVYKELSADDPEVTEIESLCVQCQENGITRMLLTKIPFYKEVVIMSFSCNNCHWENNELQPASKIQEKGILYRLKVQSMKDLVRIVVKTEWASVAIPELDFEIPSQSQEGVVTTVEGIIGRTCAGLNSKLEYLKNEDPESACKLTEFLKKISQLKTGEVPFTFVLQDCTGNSFVENICAPMADPQLHISHFDRSNDENLMLGIYNLDIENAEDNSSAAELSRETDDVNDEVIGLPTNCHSCNAPCITNMKLTQIPHFTDVVIMSTICDVCGHKTNEVKSSSGIAALGVKISLRIEDSKDLTRDVLKSDTCCISIQELELEVGSAAFGSRYSTVEGILTTIKEQLIECNPFVTGDSADASVKEKMKRFLEKIDEIISGQRKVTFILNDPCGNSYLQSLGDENTDTNLTIEHYVRSMEQEEELGILDMKVENYEES